MIFFILFLILVALSSSHISRTISTVLKYLSTTFHCHSVALEASKNRLFTKTYRKVFGVLYKKYFGA
jgi:hypothetical protein